MGISLWEFWSSASWPPTTSTAIWQGREVDAVDVYFRYGRGVDSTGSRGSVREQSRGEVDLPQCDVVASSVAMGESVCPPKQFHARPGGGEARTMPSSEVDLFGNAACHALVDAMAAFAALASGGGAGDLSRSSFLPYQLLATNC